MGAHYDVYGDQEGADDNASGVAGLLELARLLAKEKLDYRIDFVAYTLEEPPFFRTEKMGSYVHANYLKENSITVKGMICLEMIGYYKDEANTQTCPIKEMSAIYGNRANFITVVQNEKSGNFGSKIENLMKKQKLIPTVSFKGSSLVTGVDFSDHLNYWNLNYPAVMITNTSFYRNKNYHTNKDSLETLNINKMSAVIQQLYITIKEL
ncbi:M28 family peptidase [Cellulophaga fucicola]|uniref:M28 family peptidase n=1 Tax=Cellulophaga fucicola TaxID=76595 RepID=UPI001FCD8C2B|nr:M28 family peptidase [Cellulophaga fucicola]